MTASPPPRPLTHDLLKAVIEKLGGEVQDVVITRMVEHTYFAEVRIRNASGEVLAIDSRPSDAIALAVHHSPSKPIFVSEEVLLTVIP